MCFICEFPLYHMLPPIHLPVIEVQFWCFYSEGIRRGRVLLPEKSAATTSTRGEAGNENAVASCPSLDASSSLSVMSKVEKTDVERTRPPPVKVLSGQLRAAGNWGTADSAAGCVIRLGRGRSLPVSLVWMQGTVLEVQQDRDTVLLMDETGTFIVQGVNNIPKGKPCLSQGNWPRPKLDSVSIHTEAKINPPPPEQLLAIRHIYR